MSSSAERIQHLKEEVAHQVSNSAGIDIGPGQVRVQVELDEEHLVAENREDRDAVSGGAD